jgi:hypothetical protein
MTWIRSGELRAVNAATHAGGRPRYLIDLADIAAFEAARSASPAPKPTRRRRSKPGDTVEFFGPRGEVLRTL